MSWMEIVKSVLASFFGVQSDANRRRDFEHGRAVNFVIVGIIMTTLFILALVGIVQVVLWIAGGPPQSW